MIVADDHAHVAARAIDAIDVVAHFFDAVLGRGLLGALNGH
jgi:hypothetical protein